MRKIFLTLILIFSMCFYTSTSFATSTININGLTEEEIIKQYEEIKRERERIKLSRDSKIDIIKNNNLTIESLKVDALDAVQTASIRIDVLLERIQKNDIVITTEVIKNLTELLETIQIANQTIKQEAEALEEIVKMVKIKGYDSLVLTVLDSAIEKQNSIIVSYKQIIKELGELNENTM